MKCNNCDHPNDMHRIVVLKISEDDKGLPTKICKICTWCSIYDSTGKFE